MMAGRARAADAAGDTVAQGRRHIWAATATLAILLSFVLIGTAVGKPAPAIAAPAQFVRGEIPGLVTAYDSRQALAAAIRQMEELAALEEKSPAEFDRIVDAMWLKRQQGASHAEVSALARKIMNGLASRYLPIASDEALMDHYVLIQQRLEALRRVDVKICAEIVHPTGRPADTRNIVPPELIQSEVENVAAIIRDSDPKRALVPDPQAADRISDYALSSLSRTQRRAFFGDHPYSKDAELVCDAAIDYFRAFNEIPLAERGHALRVLNTY